MTRPATGPRPPSQCSRVTNGRQILVGVNGNTAQARRYRDLVEALQAELGDGLTEAERLQVRNCAALQMHAETLAASLVRGEPVDAEAFTRAANGATRALAALKRRKPIKPAKPALADYLAGKAASA